MALVYASIDRNARNSGNTRNARNRVNVRALGSVAVHHLIIICSQMTFSQYCRSCVTDSLWKACVSLAVVLRDYNNYIHRVIVLTLSIDLCSFAMPVNELLLMFVTSFCCIIIYVLFMSRALGTTTTVTCMN